MESKLEEKYKKYYKYKSDYESKYKNELKKIQLDKTLALETKRNKVKELRERFKCMNCKKSGGNIFGNVSGMLTVICGNKDSPCDVGDRYNVESSYVENLRDVQTSHKEELKSIRNKIISTKLDHLFGFTSEETTLSEFEVLKSNMKSLSKKQSNTEAAYEKVVENKEKQDIIRKNKQTIQATIKDIKSNILNYKNTQNNELLKNNIEIYCQKLLKQIEEYRNLKYEVNDVLLMPVRLVQEPFKYMSLYVSGNREDSIPKWNELTEAEQNNILEELLN